MKTKKLLVILILITLIPLTLFAQRTVGSYEIRGFAGIGMPMTPDDFKDYWKGGIGYGGEFIYNFSGTMGLGIRFHHLPFPLDTDEMKKMIDPLIEYMIGPLPQGISYDFDGFAINTNIISANLLYYLTPPEIPANLYLTGGLSYYMINISDLDISVTYMGETIYEETVEMEDEFDETFGFNVGAGVEFNAGNIINIFAEARYNYRFGEEFGGEGDSEVEVDSSPGSLSFISIIAGVNFSLF